jgi:sterol desaturase/sphingolipid hydroxylase (fatty acid hydroxylase superfamily)
VLKKKKFYICKPHKRRFMKISILIVGILVIVLAALLLANAVLNIVDPSNLLFSQNVVNLTISVVLIILAAEYFNESKQ